MVTVSPKPLLLGRWRLLRRLTKHADGCVLLVSDGRHDDRRCVLKAFRSPDGEMLDTARREFLTLRRLRHPNIAQVQDIGTLDLSAAEHDDLASTADGVEFLDTLPRDANGRTESSIAFITFEHFDGVDLADFYRSIFPAADRADTQRLHGTALEDLAPSDRWRLFLESIAKICEGLDHVHSHGLVHYDIKPQNILLTPPGSLDCNTSPPSGLDARLIDFGLCEPETTPLGTRARGTVPFIAPEILHDGTADRRSDLFSLGVAIAWSILDHSPFEGRDPGEWMRAARDGRIVDMNRLPNSPPADLAVLLTRLLSPDPDGRPATARDVITELELIGGFQHLRGETASLQDVPTIGWERELHLVHDEIELLHRDDSTTAVFLLETGHGQFTERFVSEIEAMVRAGNGDFVCGNCPQPRHAVCHPFWEILRELCCWIDLSAPRWEPYHDVLSLFLPDLPGAGPLQATGSLNESMFTDRLTELFLEAGRGHPLVLCIRDLHRADPSAIRVFQSIARNLALERQQHESRETLTRSRPSRLLLVATFEEPDLQTDDIESRSQLEEIKTLAESTYTRRLRLRDLSLDRLHEWIDARAPQLHVSSRLLHKLFQRSAGVPRLLDELVRRLSPDPADETLRMPQNVVEAMLDRLHDLPLPDRRLLELIAVAGRQPLSIDVIHHCDERRAPAGKSPGSQARDKANAGAIERLDAQLRRLEEQGWIERRHEGEATSVTWSCGPARQQLYTQLPPDRRRACHGAICEALRADHDDHDDHVPACRTLEDVSHHAFHGGLSQIFVDSGVQAADRMLHLHDLRGATRLYETVLDEVSGNASTSTSSRNAHTDGGHQDIDDGNHSALLLKLNQKLVRAYRAQHELSRAIEKLTVLLSLQPTDRASLELGRIYRQMGEIYDESGETTNATPFFEKSLKTVRSFTSASQDETSPLPGERLEELCRTLLAFGKHLLGRNEISHAAEKLEECRELAAAGGGLHLELSAVNLLLAQIDAQRNDHVRALALTRDALAIAERSGSSTSIARAIRALCDSHVARGVHERAIECIRRGIELAAEHGDKAEVADCYNSLGTVQYNSGDYLHAQESYERCLLLSRQLGADARIAKSYNNLGNICRFREQTEKASEYYKLAIDIFSRLNLKSNQATCMNNLAGVLEREARFREALDYAFRGLERRRQTNATRGIAFSYYRIGMTYQAKGELAKAAGYAQRSLRLRNDLRAKVDIAYSELQLAELQLSLGSLAPAFRHCEKSLGNFEGLENSNGELMAREVRARLLVQAGCLEEAERTLEDCVRKARENELQFVVGCSVLQLALLKLERGQLADSERRLEEAEKLFRRTRHQRKLVESLLAMATLHLEMGHLERADGQLEEAYSLLEKLGIRDLVPAYFLLRSRLTSETPGSDLDVIDKFLQRGLVEARESGLKDLRWRLHAALGQLEQRRGDFLVARIHFREACGVLDEMRQDLPSELDRSFFRLRDRAIVLKLSAEPPESAGVARIDRRAGGAGSATSEEPRALPVEDPAIHASVNHALLRLHEIVTARGTESRLELLLERIMDAVIDLSKAERGFLILQDDRSRGGNTVVARNFDREAIDDAKEKYSASITEQVIRSGEPVIAGDAISEEPFGFSRSVRDLRLRSVLCVPLSFNGEVLGAIYIDNRLRRHAFQQSELKTLQTFSDQAAIAIATARIIEATENSNIKLRNQIHKKNVQLVVAQEGLASRQTMLESRYRLDDLIGRSPVMQKVFHLVRRVARSDLPVLIEGDSGTGKDLTARAVHFNSRRRKGPLVSESCGALSEGLLDSELFGHVSGAFSGATRARQGLIERASGGTLFLDEVASMSLAMQQKLLRVLQEGEIRPVGSNQKIDVDVRIVAACGRNLHRLVERGEFREDLFYRLNVVNIRMPSLSDRAEDIPDLARHFAARVAERQGVKAPRFSAGAMQRLMAHNWPGNVRELRHMIERTLLIAGSSRIREEDLTFDPPPSTEPHTADTRSRYRLDAEAELPAFREARDTFEAHYVETAIERNGGNVAAAARMAGLSRESLYRLMKKHEIERDR